MESKFTELARSTLVTVVTPRASLDSQNASRHPKREYYLLDDPQRQAEEVYAGTKTVQAARLDSAITQGPTGTFASEMFLAPWFIPSMDVVSRFGIEAISSFREHGSI